VVIYTPCLKKNATNSNVYIFYMDYPIFIKFGINRLNKCKNMSAKFQLISRSLERDIAI